MGITRSSFSKRRATGGKQNKWRKKRKFELGRPEAGTKLSSHVSVKKVRVRGGNYKFRAMRLDTGTYSWASEHCTRKVRILDVSYNATNNELVRTQTLVKNAIVQVDATPFKTYYLQHYDVDLGKKKVEKGEPKSELTQKKIAARQATRTLDPLLEEQFLTGRLYAAIGSRPGQCGRADGYILEGRELEFYLKKMQKKKGKAAA